MVGNDVAFHFNPRFDGDVTVRNSKESGGWQNEEREQECFPFTRGEEFEIDFEIKESCFCVSD